MEGMVKKIYIQMNKETCKGYIEQDYVYIYIFNNSQIFSSFNLLRNYSY